LSFEQNTEVKSLLMQTTLNSLTEVPLPGCCSFISSPSVYAFPE